MANRTLKNSYYVLLRHFGVRAILLPRLLTPSVKNYLAGTQTNTHDDPLKVKVVILPTNFFVQEKLGELRGDIKIGDKHFLISNKLIVKLNDNIEIGDKTYRIVSIIDYDDDAVHGVMRNIQDES